MQPQPHIVNSNNPTQQSEPDKLEEEEEEMEGPGGRAMLSWAPECGLAGGLREFEQQAGARVGPLHPPSTSPSWGPEELVEEEEEAERDTPPLLDQTEEAIHEVTVSESLEEEEVERISARMNTFRKEERKPSLFTRAIERLSFR